MYIGKVKGNIVATTKDPSLRGKKLLIVEKLDEHLNKTGKTEVAIDTVGAGNREHVLVTKGSSARIASSTNSAVDAAIVAIIDDIKVVE